MVDATNRPSAGKNRSAYTPKSDVLFGASHAPSSSCQLGRYLMPFGNDKCIFSRASFNVTQLANAVACCFGPLLLERKEIVGGAFEDLQHQAATSVRWALGETKLPFGEEIQEQFAQAGRFLDQQRKPATSQLSPELVVERLVGAFE